MGEKTAIKVLHLGDVFLDCPFSAMKAEESAVRRRETRETFARAVKYAVDEEVDLVLLTGNLTDHHYATFETMELLCRIFRAAPACRFLIAPGPHDPMTENCLYRLAGLPANVTVFDSARVSHVSFPEIGVNVFGWAFEGEAYQGSPLAIDREEPETPGITLVMGYAGVGETAGNAPLSLNEIGDFGGDYLALSGGRLFDGFHRVGTVTYAYSGALEHASYEEPGFGGGNLVTLTPVAGGGVHVEGARVNFGCRRYAMEEFDITGIESPNEVMNRITAVIKERGYGRETALRVLLTGRVPFGFAIPRTLTGENFGLATFELDDRTLPSFDDSRVARDMTVRGELCRTLIPAMRVGTDEEQHAAAYALKLGLGALDGRDVTKL